MSTTARQAALAALIALATPAMACGFHSNAAVGALNFAYPNALWVRTAVWQAQLDGLLERPEATPPANAVAARLALANRYRRVSAQLVQLRDHLASRQSAVKTPSFSVLLMGPMMWSRFEPDGDAVVLQIHADGPVSGDLVLVTDEPVLAALADGRMPLSRAMELGVLRIYGPPAAAGAVSAGIESWRPVSTPAAAARQRST